MLKLFSRLRNSEITRSTSILVSGTVLAQLIPLALQPVLRRYFEPEVFGAYSVYAGMLAILAVVTAFRYEQAIVLPESDADAANLTFAGIVIGFFFSIFLLFGIYIFKDEILKLINLKEEYSFFLFMLPLGVFLTGAYQSLNFWLLRKKAFKAIINS